MNLTESSANAGRGGEEKHPSHGAGSRRLGSRDFQVTFKFCAFRMVCVPKQLAVRRRTVKLAARADPFEMLES